MKLKINSKYFKWGMTAFSVIAGGICFYYLIFHISEFLQNIKSLFGVIMPVMFGLVIAYLLTPILNFIEQKILNPLFDRLKVKATARRKKVIRGIAVILTSLLMIFAIYALIAMLISQIVPSIQAVVSNFDGYVGDLSTWLNNLMEDNQELKNIVMPQVTTLFSALETWLDDTANLLEKSGEVLKTVSLSILSFLKVTWNFVIGFIISIYVLVSKETFSAQGKKMIYAIFETDSANSILNSLRFVHRTFIGFISGKVLDSVIIGMLCFIGTTLLGTPYAALVSVIVGVTNVIPFFGPYLGAIPCAFLILIVDLSHPMTCVTFVIFILILQQIDGNLIGPRILGDSTGLSGFWVIFSITLFGGLFGVPGMIVGVPIFAVFFAAVKGLVNRSLQRKKLPLQSGVYLDMEYIDENGEIHKTEAESSTEQNKKEKHKKLAESFPFRKNAQKVSDASSDNSSEKEIKTEEKEKHSDLK